MSRNEWETGTILLPSAEARRVRDLVRQAAETHAEMLYQRAQGFWKGLAPRERRDASAYEAALDRALDRIDEDTALFLAVLGYPKPRCGEARISFDGRKLQWRVPENNHHGLLRAALSGRRVLIAQQPSASGTPASKNLLQRLARQS